MSTPCDTAAPTRHPPGEAHAAPRALPLTTRLAQVAAPSGYLGGAAARGSTTRSPIEQPLSPLSPRDNTTRDIPTPTHPTTSTFCRPKRIRRHQTTRDRARRHQALVGGVSDADAAHHSLPQRPLQADSGPETPPTAFATSSPIEEPLSPLSPRNNTTHDAQTPTRPTTSALCRPKRIRRHPATRDSTPTSAKSPRPCRPKKLVGRLGQHGRHGRHGRHAKIRNFRSPPALKAPFPPIRVIRGQIPAFLPPTRFNPPLPTADSIPIPTPTP